MEFEVESRGHFGNTQYKYMWVREDNCTIATGLLDLEEAHNIGKDMFGAAYDLMDNEQFKELIREYYTKEDLYEEEE